MGKKYIIEIDDEDRVVNGHIIIPFELSVEGLPGKVGFTYTIENKLIPYTAPDLEQARKEAYEKGYRRALADVREEHVVCQTCVYFEQDENEEPCVRCPRNFIDQYTPKQERDAEIRVGDEVEGDEDGQRGVVIDSRFENSQVAVLTGNSKVYSWWSKCAIHKTGRHFPEIATVLEKMREETTT